MTKTTKDKTANGPKVSLKRLLCKQNIPLILPESISGCVAEIIDKFELPDDNVTKFELASILNNWHNERIERRIKILQHLQKSNKPLIWFPEKYKEEVLSIIEEE